MVATFFLFKKRYHYLDQQTLLVFYHSKAVVGWSSQLWRPQDCPSLSLFAQLALNCCGTRQWHCHLVTTHENTTMYYWAYCRAVVKAVKATTEGLPPSSSSFDITAARCGGTFEATKARQTMLVHAFIKPPALLSFLMAIQVPVVAVVYTTIYIY